MDELVRPNILLTNRPQSLKFTSRNSGRDNSVYPERDRLTHSQRLQRRFKEIWRDSVSSSAERRAASIPGRNGIYIQFAGRPGFPLKTKSLEDARSGIRLLNIREIAIDGQIVNQATVYIPYEKRGVFLKKFRQYETEETIKHKPKNQDLATSIEDMSKAVLDSFWVDPIDTLPFDAPGWCEVWLRLDTMDQDQTLLRSFFNICTQLDIGYKDQHIGFPERVVTIIRANQHQLGELIESYDFIAEIRRAQEPESFWTSQNNFEQAEWVEDLQSRIQLHADSKVYVTILDSGVNNGHPLLRPVLADQDCHTVRPEWNVNDRNGHGTLMAGICTYGDLKDALEHRNPVELISHLESVKILPNPGQEENNPDLYGVLTSQGVSLAEIQNAQVNRIICMAVTSRFQTDRGRPSSWSAAIDAISSGAHDEHKRLFIISAGNIRNPEALIQYPHSNLNISIESPAQAWNALTVGAFTKKSIVHGDAFSGYHLLASPGSLSPFSSTSFTWESKRWPNKPDIVVEGGNLLLTPNGDIDYHDDLGELTTYHQLVSKHFSTIDGTSLATAKAAWMASMIQFYYPNFWPETIRGLIVHSADWTDELLSQFSIDITRKADVARILRIAGYGVPNLTKAIHCAANSLTLIAQNAIQPFIKGASTFKTNEMHLYRLPWPREELLSLGDTRVKLRITLSFFVEPGPGEIGWKDRYRYASHGLRFDLNNTDETERDFVRRLNREANTEEDDEYAGTSGSERWQIGIQNRKMGSLHSDCWVGNAADLAACNLIGIYPVIGWWRERRHLGRYNKSSRYSLIVSLEVPQNDIDIYTPVSNMVAIPVEIQIS